MSESPSPESLILWDPEFVGDWMARNATYVRLRDRANSGRPALTVQTLGEILRTLRARRLNEPQIAGFVLELKEHFTILDLTPERAEAFAVAANDIAYLTETPFSHQEAWFAWQVALCRREGGRVMTKSPSRYTGLLPRDRLA